MYSNNILIPSCLSRRDESNYIHMYTVTSKGQFQFLASGQGQKVIYLGHVAHHLMRLDKRNILKPTPALYLNPIKSYNKNVHWPHDVII